MMKKIVMGGVFVLAVILGFGQSGNAQSPATCAKQDRDALLKFKAGITEDSNGTLKSWKDDDCCKNWNGVECNFTTGRVTRILLRARGVHWYDPAPDSVYMTGTISDSIADLTHLEKFTLDYWKNLSGPIPSSLARLTNLKLLSVAGNKLSGTIPSWLGSLTHLRTLILENNYFTGPIPTSIGNLEKLEVLHLNGNRLSGKIPESIGRMKTLNYVTLQGNFLAGSVPNSIGNLKKLNVLNISDNSLSGKIPSSIAGAAILRTLSLARNRLSGSIPPSFGELKYLEDLDLSHNNFNGKIPGGVVEIIKGLRTLDLSYNHLCIGNIPKEINATTSDFSHNDCLCKSPLRPCASEGAK